MKPSNNRNKATGRNVPVRRKQKKPNKKRGGKIITVNEGLAQARQRKAVFHLSKCANDYLRVLCNPFALYEAPCIPDQLDVPSRKVRTLMRGTMTIGTAGVGWILASSQTYPNDAFKGLFTEAAFAGTTIDAFTATGVDSIIDTQFPYLGAEVLRLGTRTVAMGLRIRYSGSELNRGGTIYGAYIGSHTLLPTGTSVTDLASHQETITHPVTRSWRSISYIPRSARDYDYGNDANGIPNTVTVRKADMVFMVTGHLGETYDFEIVQYTEICSGTGLGENVYSLSPPDVSASHSDTVGMGQMRGFFEQMGTMEPGPNLLSQAYKWISEVSPTEVSRFVESAGVLRGGVKLLTGI